MQHTELMEIILGSDREDWLYNDPKGTYVYRGDLNIRIEVRDPLEHQTNFVAEWANSQSDPSATRCYHDIYYSASIVESFMLVSVDGGRAVLPLPSPGTTTIELRDYQLAQCVDEQGTLDEYIDRCGLTVASE